MAQKALSEYLRNIRETLASQGEATTKQKALSEYLRNIRDPRRRQGRMYSLTSILTMLILAAVNGESSLRRDVMAINVIRRALRA